MKTFYSPSHLEHDPQVQFEAGELLPAVEIPLRAEKVRVAIEQRKLGPILPPEPFADDTILKVHDSGLVTFLGEAWREWAKRFGEDAPVALPPLSPPLPGQSAEDIEARFGSYAAGADAPIMRGTWPAARDAVNVALTAAKAIRDGATSAFALTRPPGHHSGREAFGGFCYLNNTAIAAQWFVDAGIKPAIIDVDYHAGNGTQSIFYRRSDVFFCSIHADPNFAYPHTIGFSDERGEGDGEGYNLNMPLANGTDWTRYEEAMKFALGATKLMNPDVVIVSLGLDTYIEDPIAGFRLTSADYLRMGEKIATLGKPVLFMFEGGYCFDMLGEIAVNVLEGFEGALSHN